MGICFALCTLIKDHGLQRKEEREAATPPEVDEVSRQETQIDLEKDPVAQPVVSTERTAEEAANEPPLAIIDEERSRRRSYTSDRSMKSERSAKSDHQIVL